MDLPLHPKFVHLPIALAILMPLLTGGLLVAIWRDWLPRRAWSLAVAAQLLLVLSGVLAMRTGEDDEDRAERAVPAAVLERHEEAAELFVWVGGLVLVLTVLPLALRSRKAFVLAGAATFAGTLAVLGLGHQTGEAGGEIVYRHMAGAAVGVPGAPGGSVAPKHRHDDDR